MPVFKFLFVFITEQFSLFENVFYNYLAMAVVGALAFSIAFRIVGMLYRLRIIEERFIGSLLHWVIRLLIFIFLFIFLSLLIFLVKLIIAFPTWVWIALFTIMVIIIACISKKIYLELADK